MITVLGYAVLLKYAGWILFVLALWALLKYALPQGLSWLRRRKYRRWIEEDQAKAYEAQLDRENREWLEAGLYEGNYPGYTMPLTREEWVMDPATDLIAGSDDSDYWRRIVRPR